MTFSSRLMVGLFSLVSLCTQAQTDLSIPEVLEPWQSWVLEGHEQIACPYVNHGNFGAKSSHICAWPSILKMNASDTGAQFSTYWNVLQESWIPLPGSLAHWPLKVQVNNKAAQVVERNGRPSLFLSAGEYQVSGAFKWQGVPESLAVPELYPDTQLKVNQTDVDFVSYERGEIWLERKNTEDKTEDAVDIWVKRKLTDGPYLSLTTLVELDVSGKMREEKLGLVLPEGFHLSGIRGDLSAYMDANGVLHANVRPGDWQIEIQATALPTQLQWHRPEQTHLWPAQEIWSYEGDEAFRTGKVSGAGLADPTVVEVPEEWKNYPAYLVGVNDKLNFQVQHRGRPLNLENRLSLTRQMWLSFDGNTFTFDDHIAGSMIDGWRFEMANPYVLKSADDQDGPVLITNMSESGQGIEYRYPQVRLNARGSIPRDQEFDVTGWNQNFEQVRTHLNLAPGTRLMAVFGADSVSRSWLDDWSIWNLFVVLLSSVFAWRLFGWLPGVLTALLFVSIFQEQNAPVVLAVNLLIAIAVRNLQPFESLKKLASGYFYFSALIGVASLLFFSAMQLQTVLHPQLEYRNFHYQEPQLADLMVEVKKNRAVNRPMREAEIQDVEQVMVSGSKLRRADYLSQRYQADALVQAGEGRPDWQWHQYTINWNSPVAEHQSVELVIFNPLQTAVLKLFGCALVFVWLYVLLKDTIRAAVSQIRVRHSTTALLLLILCPFVPEPAQAQSFPSQSLLEDLQRRVLAAPECAPQCASLTDVEISAESGKLRFEASIHALRDSAVALPDSPFWRIERMTINGDAVEQSIRQNGWRYVLVEQGMGKLVAEGRLAPVNDFQLSFKQAPPHIQVTNTVDWQVSGLNNYRLSANTLVFTATEQKRQAHTDQVSRYQVTPFVALERALSLDQDWRVETTVERIAPTTGAVSVEIPLLLGERPLSGDFEQRDAKVVVVIPAGEDSVSWRSSLERTEQLELTAPEQSNWIENWSVLSSPTWHTRFEGLPMVLESQYDDDYFLHSFYPLPGESLTMSITRPDATAGNVMAVDNVQVHLDRGQRTATMRTEINYRSTRGGEHTISVPDGYELTEVMSNDRQVNLQIEQGQLTLPIAPGRHQIVVTLRSNEPENWNFELPPLHLHAPTSNIHVNVNMNRGRWILWENGPVLGPAVVYWGQLLVFILFAVLLARIPFAPLKLWQWLLLGLGLSLNNWIALVLIVVWFGAVKAFPHTQRASAETSNKLSVVFLVFLTFVTFANLIGTIPTSLLGTPDMAITGNNSYNNHLSWFIDQTDGALPVIQVLSLPMLVYKAVMLVWVMWLSFSLVTWVKWAWQNVKPHLHWQSRKTAAKDEWRDNPEQG